MPFLQRYYILICCLVYSFVYGQTFQKTYGTTVSAQGVSVRNTNDGGFIVCGNIIVDSSNTDLCLLKTNSLGDTLWMKTYGGPAGEYEGVVQQTNDGGYVIIGTTHSFGAGQGDIIVIKTNNSGDTLWTRVYGGSGDEIGQSIAQTNDGGYIIGGHTDTFGQRGEFYMLRTNSMGDTLWTRTYGGAQHDHGFSVLQTSDNNFVLAGHSVSFNTNGGFYVVKTLPNGDTLWSRGYGGPSDSYCYSIAETSDGGYILTGTTTAFGAGGIDAMVVRINNLGDTLWARTYGSAGDEYFNCVKPVPGGGYILAGTTSRGIDSSDVYVVKIDDTGDTLWTRCFGGLKDDEGMFVDVCADSSYIVCGNTKSTLSGKAEIYLLRIDRNGNAGCSWSHMNTSISKPDSVMYGVATVPGSWPTQVGSAAFGTNHFTLHTTDGCAVFGIPAISNQQARIQLYPCPVTEELVVASEEEIRSLLIYDSFGRLCLEMKNCGTKAEVQMDSFPNGFYLAEIDGRHFRFVKQ